MSVVSVHKLAESVLVDGGNLLNFLKPYRVVVGAELALFVLLVKLQLLDCLQFRLLLPYLYVDLLQSLLESLLVLFRRRNQCETKKQETSQNQHS